MATQDFELLTAGEPSLLRQVELIVIDGHRRLYEAEGKEWSEPVAYQWLRYEDPVPVARLAEGLRTVLRERINVDAKSVDNACAEAHKRGFSN